MCSHAYAIASLRSVRLCKHVAMIWEAYHIVTTFNKTRPPSYPDLGRNRAKAFNQYCVPREGMVWKWEFIVQAFDFEPAKGEICMALPINRSVKQTIVTSKRELAQQSKSGSVRRLLRTVAVTRMVMQWMRISWQCHLLRMNWPPLRLRVRLRRRRRRHQCSTASAACAVRTLPVTKHVKG